MQRPDPFPFVIVVLNCGLLAKQDHGGPMQKQRNYQDLEQLFDTDAGKSDDQAILLEDMSKTNSPEDKSRSDGYTEIGETQFKFFVDPTYYSTCITPPATYVIARPKGLGPVLFSSEKAYVFATISEYDLAGVGEKLESYISHIRRQLEKNGETENNQADIKEQLYVVKISKHFVDRAMFNGDAVARKLAEIIEADDFDYMTYLDLLADNKQDQKCIPRKGGCTIL